MSDTPQDTHPFDPNDSGAQIYDDREGDAPRRGGWGCWVTLIATLVVFVVLMVRLERSFQQLEIRWPRWVEMVPGYVVGGLGAFWTIQRTAMLLGGLR